MAPYQQSQPGDAFIAWLAKTLWLREAETGLHCTRCGAFLGYAYDLAYEHLRQHYRDAALISLGGAAVAAIGLFYLDSRRG